MPRLDIEKMRPRLDEFLTCLLQSARLDLEFRIRARAENSSESESPEVTVEFSGSDTDLLLLRGGELLEALEDLSVRVLRLPPAERGRIAFDCRDFKTLRAAELQLTAETAAETVTRTGSPFSLNPMSARERRVIHLSLKENPAVRTESQGFGPYRKVVIFPAEKK